METSNCESKELVTSSHITEYVAESVFEEVRVSFIIRSGAFSEFADLWKKD